MASLAMEGQVITDGVQARIAVGRAKRMLNQAAALLEEAATHMPSSADCKPFHQKIPSVRESVAATARDVGQLYAIMPR